MSDIPHALVRFAGQYNGVTFVEAMRFLCDQLQTEGPFHLRFFDDPAIIIWRGMSRLAAAVVADLVNGRHLHLRPCEAELYAIDGVAMDLPISDGRLPGWFPCLLSAGSSSNTDWIVEVGE